MKDELRILDDDKKWARARITKLDAEIQALGPEFYDVFNQSSETWHDNAPFDALRDRQSVLDAERQQLKQLLRASLPSLPKPKKGIAGIGTTVTLSNGKTYAIAGDWTPHAGQLKNGALVISCNTPLAKELSGKRTDATVTFGKVTATITNIATL